MILPGVGEAAAQADQRNALDRVHINAREAQLVEIGHQLKISARALADAYRTQNLLVLVRWERDNDLRDTIGSDDGVQIAHGAEGLEASEVRRLPVQVVDEALHTI